MHPDVALIIPAFNEAESLRELLPRLVPLQLGAVIVVDNGSTDDTATIATAEGCCVVHEPRRGYGRACFAGLQALPNHCRVVAFMDADLSDPPDHLPELVAPIRSDRADLVIGVRDSALCEPGALTVPQRFGNWLATRLIAWGWGYRYDDLGPFRAIRRSSLEDMQMRDRGFGWTVEMQVRALQMGLRVVQTPVPYRRRVFGRSKISGTVRGVAFAGFTILTTIGRLYCRR